MALIPPDIPGLITKQREISERVDKLSKNMNIDEMRAHYRSEIAKKRHMAVKTAKIGQKLREKEERDYQKHYGRPKYPTVSTPDPNLAFKQKKKKDWNVFDHLDWANDLADRVSK